MKIKEVEKQIGITRANIRYYEMQGLLTPLRNQENNYREYTQEDIDSLERIKILRTLGITIAEIKQLNAGTLQLTEAAENRLIQIHEEEQKLLNIRQVCEFILQNDISFQAVDRQFLYHAAKNGHDWKYELTKIWQEDTDKRFYGRDVLFALDFIVNCGLIVLIVFYYRHLYRKVGPQTFFSEMIFAGVGIPLIGGITSLLTAAIELFYGILRIKGKKPYDTVILRQWPVMWMMIKCMLLFMGITAWLAGIHLFS